MDNNLRYAQTTSPVVREPDDFLSRGTATLLPTDRDFYAGIQGIEVEVRSFEDLEPGTFVVVGPVNGGWHVLAADFLGS